MITILIFLLVLTILILVHEGGHFLAARAMGIGVEEFAFGLPFTPPLWSKKLKSGLKLAVYPLFFGGFVKLQGEEFGNKSGDFSNSSIKKRSLVIAAGVAANFLLGAIILSFLFTQGVLSPTDKVKINAITANSPAEKSGLQVGDWVIKINGISVKSPDELIKKTQENVGKEVVLEVHRDYPAEQDPASRDKSYKIIPRIVPPSGEGPLGIAISNLEEQKFSWWEAPIKGFTESAKLVGEMFKGLGQILWQAVTQGRVPKDISGPVGVAKLTGAAATAGGRGILELLFLLSLNLAVINAIPFPALDGGRFVFVLFEPILGRERRERWEKKANSAGMFLLLLLMGLITINDVKHLR